MQAIRIGGYQGPDSILSTSLQSLAEQLRASFSDARDGWNVVTVGNVTSNGESAGALFTSIETGARHLGYMASGCLVKQVPELSLLDIPFAIQDRAAALNALDGEVGQWLAQFIEQRTGFRLLGWWDNGFRHISNRVRPITTPQDCKGLKIRTLDRAVYRDSLRAIGFAPASIDVRDFPSAISEGAVDAQENPLTNFSLFGVGQYHKYLSLTSHFFGVLLVVANRDWFNSLGKDKQSWVKDACDQAVAKQRELALNEDSCVASTLNGNGLQVVDASNIDLVGMTHATREVRASIQSNFPLAITRRHLQNGR